MAGVRLEDLARINRDKVISPAFCRAVKRSPHCNIPYFWTLNARPAPEPPPTGVGSSGTGQRPCLPPRSQSPSSSATCSCASALPCIGSSWQAVVAALLARA